jgi:hypothetical protein
MISTSLRRAILAAAGLILLLAPVVARSLILGYNQRGYSPPAIPAMNIIATPAHTATPFALAPPANLIQRLRPGLVVVDLAHGNRLNRHQFQPLAAALAEAGVGTHFWLTDVNVLEIESFLDFPDQSDKLAALLPGASGLVVSSPFFLWSKPEIELVERFVADGGRLLLISDPDVVGDTAQDINNLAEPFGVVFNDDYLYDTVKNDGNYVHILLSHFLDQATGLIGSKVALYGARSISGAVLPQALSADTTLSSVRDGISGFTTLAVAGIASRGTAGRVLALSDFDVLTEPYMRRHDNARLVEFVAAFLAGAERENTVIDFPVYLHQEVALIFGDAAVTTELLAQGARLQSALDKTGRSLTLASTALLTASLAASSSPRDLIVLADFTMAEQEPGLLDELGFQRVEETATPTPASSELGAEFNPSSAGALATAMTATFSPTVEATGPTTATVVDESLPIANDAALTGALTIAAMPTPTSTPQVTVYLVNRDGIRLLAKETVLIAQRQGEEARLVAVLGHDATGIGAGIERLLAGDYAGCIVSSDLAICSSASKEETTKADDKAKGDKSDKTEKDEKNASGAATPEATPTAKPAGEDGQKVSILVIDNNDLAGDSEVSEADRYLQGLTQAGYQPDLWTTASKGTPALDDLKEYRWVIWSDGGYESGGPSLADLDAILSYINAGGRLTISSQRPFFGMSDRDPSVVADIVIDETVPELVQGLPTEPVALPNGLPPVAPIEAASEDGGPQVVLRRGPASSDAGAPLLFVVTDANEESPTGARLIVLGMSLTWLPNEYGAQLVGNMAGWVLAD